MLLLSSVAANAQHRDCITEQKLIVETDGVRKTKNETVILCYNGDAISIVSKTMGSVVFSVYNVHSDINPMGYKWEYMWNAKDSRYDKDRYKVEITHGPVKEFNISDGSKTYIVQTKNKYFVQYEIPNYDVKERIDQSANAYVNYSLDSFVNARFSWRDNERSSVDCRVAVKLFIEGDGTIDWPTSTLQGECAPKNQGFLDRIKLAMNDSRFVPAKDKSGNSTGQYYETTLHIKGPATNNTTGATNDSRQTPENTASKQEESKKQDAAQKDAAKDAKNTAKDGAKKILKGFGRP